MLELLAGAGILAAGWVVGRVTRLRRASAPVKAICGCSHHIGGHVNKTGRCMMTIKGTRPTGFHANGAVVSWEQVPCRCQVYDGPELISSFAVNQVVQLPPASEE